MGNYVFLFINFQSALTELCQLLYLMNKLGLEFQQILQAKSTILNFAVPYWIM